MTLSSQQRVGIYLTLSHWCKGGAESVDRLRMARTIRAKMKIDESDLQSVSGGVLFEVGEVDVQLSKREQAVIQSAVRWRENRFQENGETVPEWLAAAGEVATRNQSSAKAVAERFNEWSNLAFALAGGAMLLIRPGLFSGTVAVLFLYLSAASWYAHARETEEAWDLDVQAMYMATAALAGYGWSAHLEGALAFSLALGTGLALSQEWTPMMWVMPGLVLLGATSLPPLYAAAVAGVFAVAGGLRLLSGRVRKPWSYILHGSWHIVAVLDAVFLVYLTV
jgi:hypothetical protein